MTVEIYTASGCARCNITKRYMKENAIDYKEFDFKSEGKEAFAQFYRANRNNIFRDKDGVEFPVLYDGKEVRQGVSVILGYLIAGSKLAGFIGRSLLHGEWIDGFDISAGDPSEVNHLAAVLSHLKGNGLKVQVTTNGKNVSVLETLIDKNLCDKVIMDVKGPVRLYEKLIGLNIQEDELKKSINLSTTVPDYAFFTDIVPFEREEGIIEFLTPEEIGETARIIEEATGNKKHPYTLRSFNPGQSNDARLKALEPLPSSAMFKYRTAARRYQVSTEIAK